jgi:SAM-dependent methyltransferase
VINRPAHFMPEVAASFQDEGVVVAYQYRPPYPAAVFDRLTDLIADEPGAVLDLGCGTGFLARPLATRGVRVDAVDVSAAMIEEGKRLPGGDHPGLTWIVGRAEEAPLRPPYALATAGASLHWMDWAVVLPRLADVLTPGSVLAIVDVETAWPTGPLPWRQQLDELVRRYTTVKEWAPGFDLMAELERCGLFHPLGRVQTPHEPFVQGVEDYVESWHGRATLSRARMGPEDAAAFDAAVRQMVASHTGETITWHLVGTILWGKPLHPLGT